MFSTAARIYNHGHYIWNFAIYQFRFHSLQVKGSFISSITKLVFESPNEFSNDAGRLKNKEY